MKATENLWASVLAMTLASSLAMAAEPAQDPATVRQHAEQSFNQLKQANQQESSKPRAQARPSVNDNGGNYSGEQYLIGKGQGDMTKGKIVCQRVSELSARTDLAKQIRILVKEHMVDRIRERTGREAEQDIEVTREEIVQEYLQGVKIVDRQVDEENKTCSATAVMPKNQIQPKQPPDQPEPISTIVR
jgi:hypothetical protein